TPPYPEAVALGTWVGGKHWPYFDGWCAARNVDPRALEWERFLNLAYYYLSGDTKKQRDKVDSLLARATSQWNQVRMRELNRVAVPEPAPIKSDVDAPQGKRKQRRLPAPPPGWGSPDDALRSNMAAAQALKRGGR